MAAHQSIVPYLYYRDGNAALAFLCEAFGFEERRRHARPDGTLMHAEAGQGDSVVMLGTPVDEDGKPSLGEVPVRHAGVFCTVADVDAHCRRARERGAEITAPPADRPDGMRMYAAVDPEGQQWFFAQAETGEGGA